MHLLRKISRWAIFVLLASCATVFSTEEKYGDSRVLYYSDYTVTFFIEDVDTKITTDHEVTYTYFQGDRILRSQGDYDGRLLGGEYKELYLNKSLKTRGTYRKGVRHGEWKTWDDQGKLTEISNWKEGKLNGEYKKYYKGQLAKEYTYKDNELVEKEEKGKKESQEKKASSTPKKEKKPEKKE